MSVLFSWAIRYLHHIYIESYPPPRPHKNEKQLRRECEAALRALSTSQQADIEIDALYEGCDLRCVRFVLVCVSPLCVRERGEAARKAHKSHPSKPNAPTHPKTRTPKQTHNTPKKNSTRIARARFEGECLDLLKGCLAALEQALTGAVRGLFERVCIYMMYYISFVYTHSKLIPQNHKYTHIISYI